MLTVSKSKFLPSVVCSLRLSATLFFVFCLIFLRPNLSWGSGEMAVYTFDEGSDGDPNGAVFDQSGLNHRGTLYSGAEIVESGEGFALQLDGGPAWVKCTSGRMPYEMDPFSVEFAMQLDSLKPGMVMGKKTDQPDAPGWVINLGKDGGELLFTFSDGEATEVLAAPLPNPEAWHHVIMVRKGDTVTVYVDGEEAGKKSSPVFAGNLQSEEKHLHLGKILGRFKSIHGKLDNVIIRNEAMSPGDVTKAHRKASELMPELGMLGAANAPIGEESGLVLHYRFDKDPGTKVTDLSGHGNDAEIGDTEYLQEVEGRQGVLRFNGNDSWLDVGNPKSLQFAGDLTIEMWVRKNRELEEGANAWQAFIFGEYPDVGRLSLGWVFYHTLQLRYANRKVGGSMVVPVPRDTIDSEWSHISVVIEYPRCRFYRDGVLVRDALMPLPGVEKLRGPKFIGGIRPGKFKEDSPVKGNCAPVDLSEFRLYKRALTAEEVAAHAKGDYPQPAVSEALALEPDWYGETLAARFTVKGKKIKDGKAEFVLNEGGKEVARETVPLVSVSENESLRFAATANFPLGKLKDKKVTVQASFSGGAPVDQMVTLTKPDWIKNQFGRPTSVPSPWTPITMSEGPGGETDFKVWDRIYSFGEGPFPTRIQAKGSPLLVAPISLGAETSGGNPVAWKIGKRTLEKAEEGLSVTAQQSLQGGGLEVQVKSVLEYDGYLFYDCEVTAQKDTTIDRLDLTIPLVTEHVELCAASNVFEKNKKISMSESYWDAIHGDLDFLFGPTVWLGDNERGLTWQSESNEFWRNADPQKAVQLRPSKDTTTFRANFIDTPTKLASGETLHYQFALLATPVKPMLKTSWDLRVMRGGPYGRVLSLPEMTVDGKPQLKYLADLGVRTISYMTGDLWPWPMPVHKRYGEALKNLNDAAHEAGLKTVPYLFHVRFPVMTEAFDQYGRNIVEVPLRPYLHKGNLPPIDNPRPGPIAMYLGAESQGTMSYCPKSQAAQDAYLANYVERINTYGDDGIYMDGTGQVVPCMNQEHGCGYVGSDGEVHPTYPVFAARDFSRRIYNTVKSLKPDGVVDLHYWQPNPAQAAYADILFTGEQWHHLRTTGTDYVAGELTLPRFRSMFMGYQVGTPVDLMSYRLGSTRRVAATALLHDVPVRLNQGGHDAEHLAHPVPGTASTGMQEADYFRLLPALWKLRDAFGMNDAKTLFYWDNQDYVTVTPEKCYATLFTHPKHGVLAIVSNLSRDRQEVKVQLHLEKLGLAGQELEAEDPLNDKILDLENGAVTIPLQSEDWVYIWVKPKGLSLDPVALNP